MLIKSIYVYLISAVTLIMSVVGGITLISNALSLTTFTGYVEPYEDFVRNRCMNYGDPAMVAPVSVDMSRKIAATSIAMPAAPTCNLNEAVVDPVWKTRYEAYMNELKEQDKRQKLDRMLKAVPLTIVPIPVFFLFQKKRKEL